MPLPADSGLGTKTKEYEDFFWTTHSEVETQQIQLFNQNSGGAIVLANDNFRGNIETEAFYKHNANLIQHRDIYNNKEVNDERLEMSEKTRIKLSRRIGPVVWTAEQYRNQMRNPAENAAVAGRQAAIDGVAEMLNTGLLAAATAMSTATKIVHDATSTPGVNWHTLARGTRLLGDNAGKIKSWVMHSAQFFDLYEGNLSNENCLFTFDNVTVYRDPLGKIIYVTDSPSLFDETDGVYNILGLNQLSIGLDRTGVMDSVINKIAGNENITYRQQSEYSYLLQLQGFSWIETTGGKNPTGDKLSSAANWKSHFESHKDLGGVLIKVKEKV